MDGGKSLGGGKEIESWNGREIPPDGIFECWMRQMDLGGWGTLSQGDVGV